ncbi:MAG: hypothetical protein ABI690_00110 [Chloroflexota bacterium]
MNEADLFDQYLDTLRRNPDAAPPSGLDSETATFIRALAAAERSPAPPQSIQDRIWHKALTLAQSEEDTFRRPSSPNDQIDQKLTVIKPGEKIQLEPDDRVAQTESIQPEAPSTRPPTTRHIWQYTLTIAAAVLLVALLGALLIQMANRNPRDGYPGSEFIGTDTPTPTIQPTTPAPPCEWGADYMTRGQVSINAGDYAAASADFNCAITNDPTNYVAYLWRGGLAALDGDYDQLGNNLYTFYTHRSSSTDPMRLAVVKAIPALTSAIAAHPDDPAPYMLRGLAYIVADLQLSAQPDFERLIELLPNNAVGYLFTWSINQTTLQDLTDPNIEKGEALAPGSILVDWIRWTNLTQADVESYRPIFDRAAQRNPQHRFAFGAMGIADALLGDMTAAAQDFYQHIQNNQVKSVDGDALIVGKAVTLNVSAGNVYHLPFTVQAGQKLSFTIGRESGSIFWAFPITEVILTPDGEVLTVPYHVQIQYGNTVIPITGLEVPIDGTYTLLLAPNYSGQISIRLSESK